MKVTPIKKKFGKYAPGDVFDLPDKAARLFIKVGKLAAVTAAPAAAPTYQTRMMTAEVRAPYGLKADGTPRARPGRPARAG